MRKIRNFKLVLRPRELARRAKKARLQLEAAGLASEDMLATFLEDFGRRLKPAVVYESYPATKDVSLAPIPGVASSLGIASLGREAEAALEAVLAQPEGAARVPAARLAAEMALEQAVQFVLTLLEDEAAQEGCALSPLSPLSEPDALSACVERLGASRIGVAFEDGRLAPLHTAAFSVSWLVKSKSKAKKS